VPDGTPVAELSGLPESTTHYPPPTTHHPLRPFATNPIFPACGENGKFESSFPEQVSPKYGVRSYGQARTKGKESQPRQASR
jgi:hypothetical protein